MSVWKSFRPKGTSHPAALTLANEETIFVSGVGGHLPDGSISDDAHEQIRQTLRNIAALLEREGSSLEEVVWVHPYLSDIADVDALTPAMTEAFGEAPPASAGLLGGVVLVDPRMKVEIEAVAVRGARRELRES
ncbi:RidA family protein [Arthrobacter sp. CAU 1506]|uniref:Rid family hydrolase n=1 Tax=Arthrobacter sp. CAU 1506 TaxID=2560052 RepID=UPI0010ABB0C6|nr:Rid family hydrolase [Arthrobacter sp. CAU 1506]TJY66253.1 RidA family protein [Arthrobacter sp. CAU 1506]